MTNRRRGYDPQLDLFIPFISDLPLRDQRETMERPFFSLSKRKRIKPIDYTSRDSSVWVKVIAPTELGMATIWDADILIWAASTLLEMRRRGVNDVPRKLTFQPYDVLKAIGRSTGGQDYERLKTALARLSATTVRTNIRAAGKKKYHQFTWIQDLAYLEDEQTGESRGMSFSLPDWLYEGIVMDGGVLAITPEYFTITGGRERWLYRVARKHAGGHGCEGFGIQLSTLFEKSGAEGNFRRFKYEIRKIALQDTLPEFHLRWEEPQDEDSEAVLRMIRRDHLTEIDPAYAPARRRVQQIS